MRIAPEAHRAFPVACGCLASLVMIIGYLSCSWGAAVAHFTNAASHAGSALKTTLLCQR